MIECNPRMVVLSNVVSHFLVNFRDLKKQVELRIKKQQTRAQLEALPEYLYQDINLSKEKVQCEIKKTFWD